MSKNSLDGEHHCSLSFNCLDEDSGFKPGKLYFVILYAAFR